MKLIEKLCPFCEKFFDKESIKDHIALEHLGLESGQFIEESLVEETTPESPQKLDNSDESVSPEVKHKCKVCQKEFISERSFNLHTKFVHSKPKIDEAEEAKEVDEFEEDEEVDEADQVVNDNECKKCNKIFCDKHTLMRHLREVHDQKDKVVKDNECHMCNKTFARKDVLKRHLRQVHKEKKRKIRRMQKDEQNKPQKHARKVHDQKKIHCHELFED